jgi:hypothetical protein
MTGKRRSGSPTGKSSFQTHIMVRQLPYEDRRVERPYHQSVYLPGKDFLLRGKIARVNGKYYQKKVTV